jgi:hypothetical protein
MIQPGRQTLSPLPQGKTQGCPEFTAWWEARDISGSVAGRGRLRFEYASFQGPTTIRRR